MTKPVIYLISDDEKENEGAAQEKSVKTLVRKARPTKQPSPEHLEIPSPSRETLPPSTPAGRLALPDLIGMEDIRREVNNVTPEERLEWDHERDIHSSATRFPGLKRMRKRARSSSPIGSSPARASAHFPMKGEPLNQQVDPGSDLWGRYSTSGSAAPTPQGHPLPPSLAHLMQTSSPQPLKEGALPRTASFRRANSCGNQFPKRRKIDKDDMFSEGIAVGPSRLSVLIERVQEGLSQAPKPETKSTSGSSQESSSAENKSQTPTRRPSDKTVSVAIGPPNLAMTDSGSAAPRHAESEMLLSGGSDYGDDFDDDDLDEDLLAAVESTATKSIEPPAVKVPPDDRRHNASLNEKMPSLAPAHSLAKSSSPSTIGKARGEFDEFDDDESMTADLEMVLSQFDAKSAVKKNIRFTPPKAVSKSRTIPDSDDEDEFGDGGLDEGDFDAAEATATQSIQQSANSLIPVRTRYP